MTLKDYIFIASLNGILVSTGHIVFNGPEKPQEAPQVDQAPVRVLTPPPEPTPSPEPTTKPEPRVIYDPNYSYAMLSNGPVVVLSIGETKGVFSLGEVTQYGTLIAVRQDGALARSFRGEVFISPVQWVEE